VKAVPTSSLIPITTHSVSAFDRLRKIHQLARVGSSPSADSFLCSTLLPVQKDHSLQKSLSAGRKRQRDDSEDESDSLRERKSRRYSLSESDDSDADSSDSDIFAEARHLLQESLFNRVLISMESPSSSKEKNT
jgi:hypothetical protein